jgi:hypothetical protein
MASVGWATNDNLSAEIVLGEHLNQLTQQLWESVLERLKPLGKCIRYGNRELSHVLGCSSLLQGAQQNFLLQTTICLPRNDAVRHAIPGDMAWAGQLYDVGEAGPAYVD